MKKTFFKRKSTHTRVFSVITAVLILCLLVLNIFLNQVGIKRLWYVDLTPEGFYTLTDKMEDYCHTLLDGEDAEGNKKEIKITFCTDQDYIVRSRELRVTYFMALALAKEFDNVTVETVNVVYNPTAVSKYKTTSRDSIASTDIIVSYGSKYRVLAAQSFWTVDSDGNEFSYNGEYKLASILASLTAITSPAAYFVTDLGSSFYDPENPESEMSISMAGFADLLTERGFKIKSLSICDPETTKIPDDCALLIINNPTKDLTTDPSQYNQLGYISPAEKIDRYLIEGLGTLIFNKAYDVKLPIMESLLAEWGIAFGEGLVGDEKMEFPAPEGGDGYYTLGVYNTDSESFGSAYYENYANLSSAPEMLFRDSGYVYCSFVDGDTMQEPGTYNASKMYGTFIGTTDEAIAGFGTEITSTEGFKSYASVSTRTFLDHLSGETSYSYIFASNSEHFYSNEILSNTSFANYDILSSLISGISRTERYADMALGGTSPNSSSFGGKQLVDNTLKTYAHDVYSPDGMDVVRTNKAFNVSSRKWYTTLVIIPPAAALVLGVVVFIKRRYL